MEKSKKQNLQKGKGFKLPECFAHCWLTLIKSTKRQEMLCFIHHLFFLFHFFVIAFHYAWQKSCRDCIVLKNFALLIFSFFALMGFFVFVSKNFVISPKNIMLQQFYIVIPGWVKLKKYNCYLRERFPCVSLILMSSKLKKRHNTIAFFYDWVLPIWNEISPNTYVVKNFFFIHSKL